MQRSGNPNLGWRQPSAGTLFHLQLVGLKPDQARGLRQTASQFGSEIWIERNGRRVNAKSIMGVMMLAASKGSKVTLEIAGNDEAPAMTALTELIGNRFGEPE